VPARSPSPEEAQSLIARFYEPFAVVEPRIDALFKRHRGFVTRTGDPFYFVRACHVVGRALIERGGDDPHRRARKAQVLARDGLSWQPYDPFLWSLWRDALIVEGEIEAAELVGWEKMRRLPANAEAHNDLAGLLARDPNRRYEAEALFRYSIKRFPTNPFPRSRLAELLLLQDRISEATAVVDETFSAGIHNVVTYAIRARLHSFAGDQELAREDIEAGLALDPSNGVLLVLRDRLDHGETLPLKSRELQLPLPVNRGLRDEEDPALYAAMRSGRMRRLRFRLEAAPDPASASYALAELRLLFREDPTFAYAELLAARQGIRHAESTAVPSVAAAFEEALREEDRAKLEGLAQRQPRLDSLILVARAVLGDESAAHEIEGWLRAEPSADETAVASVLRTGLRPMLQIIDGGRSAPEAFVSHKETIVGVLHDANEAGIDEDLSIAA
jgi:tetratricopeptide (TPR) repeat protein